MRYSPQHKDETRTKVLRAAATAMRARGTDGVGVADIMRSVGLTHGGFYAHFRSKDDLVAQAVAQMFEDGSRRFQRVTEGLPPDEALGTYIDRYISASHRDDASRGCPLTSVAADLARSEGAARAAFDAGVRGMIDRFAAWLVPDEPSRAADRAASLVAEMAGAVAMSRAISDPGLSDSILRACRAAVRAKAGLPVSDPNGAPA